MSENKPAYEFNFDKMTIADYLVFISLGGSLRMLQGYDIERVMDIAHKFCNVNPLHLPATEFANFWDQYVSAVGQHLSEMGGNTYVQP